MNLIHWNQYILILHRCVNLKKKFIWFYSILICVARLGWRIKNDTPRSLRSYTRHTRPQYIFQNHKLVQEIVKKKENVDLLSLCYNSATKRFLYCTIFLRGLLANDRSYMYPKSSEKTFKFNKGFLQFFNFHYNFFTLKNLFKKTHRVPLSVSSI